MFAKFFRKMITLKSGLVFFFIILAVAAFVAIVNASVKRYSRKYIHSDPKHVPKAHTAIILGAKVYQNGRLSGMLEDRVLTGLDLYRRGKVRKLLLSGDHGQVRYDEVNTMRKYLLARHVPARDIFMDHAGFSTYDSMYRARDVFEVSDAIVVTQKFHLNRAVYIARHLGLKASGIAADRRQYMKISRIRSGLREIPAQVKAFLYVRIFRPQPKYLGEKIPITGDGRRTKG